MKFSRVSGADRSSRLNDRTTRAHTDDRSSSNPPGIDKQSWIVSCQNRIFSESPFRPSTYYSVHALYLLRRRHTVAFAADISSLSHSSLLSLNCLVKSLSSKLRDAHFNMNLFFFSQRRTSKLCVTDATTTTMSDLAGRS